MVPQSNIIFKTFKTFWSSATQNSEQTIYKSHQVMFFLHLSVRQVYTPLYQTPQGLNYSTPNRLILP